MWRYKIGILLAILFGIVPGLCYGAYTGSNISDLGTSTPTEGNTRPSEVNNSIREIKTVLKNQWKIGSNTSSQTLTSADSFLHIYATGTQTTLPDPTTVSSTTFTKFYMVKNAGTQTITVNGNGKMIEGTTTGYTLPGSSSAFLWTDGNDWYMFKPKTVSEADNAGTLDNLDSTYFTNASNLSTGTVNLNRIPTTLTGKDADTVDTIEGASIVQTSRTLTTTSPITIDGVASADLSANRTLAIPQASGISNGYLSSTDWTTFNNKQASLGGNYLSSCNVGATSIVGSLTMVAGSGISLSPTFNGSNAGAITVTAVGTASAGGWTDTGTQTISTPAYPIKCQGQLQIDPAFGATGLADADIPNTVTIDNITQVTTRSLANMQATLSLGTQSNWTDIGSSTAGANKAIISNGSGTINWQWFRSGTVIGGAFGSSSAVVSPLGYIPFNAAPTQSDGTQVLTLSYAASGTNTVLQIKAKLNVSIGANGTYTAGVLFAGSTTPALESAWECVGNNGNNGRDTQIYLNARYTPGTTSAIIYNVNAGGGNAGTKRLNASEVDGAAHFNSTARSWIEIQELAP